MSTETSYLHRPPRRESDGDLCVPDVVDLLDGMVASAEPAVVFLSAVQLCAPQLCASAVAAVSEAGERVYRVAGPRNRPVLRDVGPSSGRDTVRAFGGVEVPPGSVVTELSGPASALHSAYDGVLVMTFDRSAPTDPLLGQLVVDRAVALVSVERLYDIAEMHRTHAEHLEAALRSNRDIGIALGIVMNTHRVTQERAFELLRVSSQHSQRKIRDLAADIIYTGELDVLGSALALSGAGPS